VGTGKGANRLLFFGAENGFAQMAKNRNGCLFRRFFFVTFFWHGKESNEKKRTIIVNRHGLQPSPNL